jgi:hypothetical protein
MECLDFYNPGRGRGHACLSLVGSVLPLTYFYVAGRMPDLWGRVTGSRYQYAGAAERRGPAGVWQKRGWVPRAHLHIVILGVTRAWAFCDR